MYWSDDPSMNIENILKKDGALKRRFQSIHVQPPSVEETISIIQGLRDRYEEHHGVQLHR